jgi:hypothetical protein
VTVSNSATRFMTATAWTLSNALNSQQRFRHTMAGFSHRHGNGVKNIRARAWEEPQSNEGKYLKDDGRSGVDWILAIQLWLC